MELFKGNMTFLLALLIQLTFGVVVPADLSDTDVADNLLLDDFDLNSVEHTSSRTFSNALARRDLDMPSYIAGALSSFRSDAGISNWELKWSSGWSEHAQKAANQCDDSAPSGKAIRGTAYEAVNAETFDIEQETKMALVFWFIEQMGEIHPNSDSIQDPNARFVGCAWSTACGGQQNDHYLKCVLAGTETPRILKRHTRNLEANSISSSDPSERDALQDFNPTHQCDQSFLRFRQDENLQYMHPNTDLAYQAYDDANHCDSRSIERELGFRVHPVTANMSIMTDAILLYWEYLAADWSHSVLKDPSLNVFGCSWSDWCDDNTLFFRCKFAHHGAETLAVLDNKTPHDAKRALDEDAYAGIHVPRSLSGLRIQHGLGEVERDVDLEAEAKVSADLCTGARDENELLFHYHWNDDRNDQDRTRLALGDWWSQDGGVSSTEAKVDYLTALRPEYTAVGCAWSDVCEDGARFLKCRLRA